MKFLVTLKRNRWTEGKLSEICDDLPTTTAAWTNPTTTATLANPMEFRCLGLSDQSAATAHGNPSRDPTKPFGDIPTGTYSGVKIDPPNVETEGDLRSYGPGPRFLLTPLSGAALNCKGVRAGLMVHGGPTGFPMRPGQLRPTHGCLRVDDETISRISTALGSKKLELEVREEQ